MLQVSIIIIHISMHFFRYGIALDSWLFPIEADVLNTGFKQSLVFINIDTFQWPKNILRMMKFVERNEATMYTLK